MNKFETNKISKPEFEKLNEENIMFITNPGRMGDEDGITFITKNDREFTIYRVNGWMYPTSRQIVDITLDDAIKQFPMWIEVWKNVEEREHNPKYKYIYMGFGNGLCVDNSIYSEFEPYLNELLKEHLKDNNSDDIKYATIFNVWEKAFMNMINDKGYHLK